MNQSGPLVMADFDVLNVMLSHEGTINFRHVKLKDEHQFRHLF